MVGSTTPTILERYTSNRQGKHLSWLAVVLITLIIGGPACRCGGRALCFL